ncbi:MAG: AAA-like domain-containing protein [Cyanobacteria bacterium P01_F01_bin.143]
MTGATNCSPSEESSKTGKRVFISYRAQEPDQTLAKAFHDRLKAANHQPFMAAESIAWGENWVDRIDQELRLCDYFLLLLSEQSVTSDMVAGEVRIAKQLKDKLGKPVILPIRVNLPLNDPLNYELRSSLETIQQKTWSSTDDTPKLLQEILKVIDAGAAPEPLDKDNIIAPVVTASSQNRPPLPVVDLELPSGTMPLNSKYYIRREPWDSRCLQEIGNRAGLVRIKAPRQMGKTSLLARIREQAHVLGYQTVTLDFLETDETTFDHLNCFLKSFCSLISLQLDMSPQKIRSYFEEYWIEDLFGPKINCNNYLQNCIFPVIDNYLLLVIDELDLLFSSDKVAKKFLMLLRAWNEKAKVDTTWAKLKMALAYSTESYVVFEDINHSPFNVGLTVELPEFTPEQVTILVDKHRLNWGTKEVTALMNMVGGHPYLIRLALYQIANQDLALDQLLAEASTDAGIYGEHLRRHLWNLKQHPDLAKAFLQVISSDSPVSLESILAFKLNGMGLINLQNDNAVLRHEPMYRPYFRSRLKVIS